MSADRPGEGAGDSAGMPWAGRSLPHGGNAADTGAPDERLVAALGADDSTFAAALAGSRVLVPIVATEGEQAEPGQRGGGAGGDSTSQMSAITLTAPDGQRALPIFSGIATMHDWNPDARPQPVPAARAAQAAVSEGCDVLVLDVGTQQMRIVAPSMVWALATERVWLPAYADPFVQEAVSRAVREEPDVVSVACEGDDAGQLRVVLRLVAGLAPEAVQTLCARVGEQLATDGETRARIDALSFRVVTAG